MSVLLNALAGKGFIMYNKSLAKEIGVTNTILLGELISLFDLFENKEFFFQRERLAEETSLNIKAVDKSLKELKDLELITVEYKGLPRKSFYKINEEKIFELAGKLVKSSVTQNGNTRLTQNGNTRLTQNGNTRLTQNGNTRVPDLVTHNNNKYNNNKHNNKHNNKNNVLMNFLDEISISDNLKKKLVEFIQYRTETKKAIKTIRPIKSLVDSIGKEYKNEEHLILSIDDSMNKEYQGVFPIKNYKEPGDDQTVEKRLKEMETILGKESD